MLNQIVLMGRLTKDPELRHTPSSVPVASFTLAVDRDFTPKDAEKETDFIDIIAWRGTAEFVSRYFTKGCMAVVSGRLQVRIWKNKNGTYRKSSEVVADNVYFGDSKKETSSVLYNVPEGFDAPSSAGLTSEFEELTDDGELPF